MRYFKFRTCNNDNFRALENYKIYASLLSDFNDPFEGDTWEDTETDISIRTYNQGERQELKISLNNRSYYCISASNNDEILCDNIQMWSHYADSHKGFCIEYDLNKLIDKGTELVKYISTNISNKELVSKRTLSLLTFPKDALKKLGI